MINRFRCSVQMFGDSKPKELEAFRDGLPLLKAEGALGPNGLDEVAMDLIDLALAVFLIERNLPGRQRTRRVMRIVAQLPARQPAVWTKDALKTLQELLYFMGGAHWQFELLQGEKIEPHVWNAGEERDVAKVALFSGGLDSLCGAADLAPSADVKLVSFYTVQKGLQRDLAKALGMEKPVQWGWARRRGFGRTKTFFYRSFLFLCLAAITARSYGCRQILQFENGILASGVAPSPSVWMTKHAHHRVHRLCESIFSVILGGEWKIQNPSMHMTKKQAYEKMVSKFEKAAAETLGNQTQTCWNLNAGFKDELLGKKPNGLPCGFCVPCIVRGTALPQKTWRDLRDDSTRNHPLHGRFFREYFGMLSSIQEVKNGSLGEFYSAMGTFLQDAVKPRGAYEIIELRRLFLDFADEFMSAYI
jgi:7-cyano-7-deazaguanine synthase in queuosine biosynthesis